jgi:hypothetical protein
VTGKSKPSRSLPGIQVNLDGQPVQLSPEELQCLTALRETLERVAKRNNALLVAMLIDLVAVRFDDEVTATKEVLSSTTKAANGKEKSAVSVAALRSRATPLLARASELALLATINSWPVVERLWWDFLPTLRSMVLNLSLLEDICGKRIASIKAGGRSLSEHLQELSPILKEVSECLAREQPMEFSDVIELRLAPWLSGLSAFLQKTE